MARAKCGACGLDKSKGGFSATQWKKKGKRCRQCITGGVGLTPGNDAEADPQLEATRLLKLFAARIQALNHEERELEDERAQLRKFKKGAKSATKANGKDLESEWQQQLQEQSRVLERERTEMESEKQRAVAQALSKMAQEKRVAVEASMLQQKAEFAKQQAEAEARVVDSAASASDVIVKLTTTSRVVPGEKLTVYWEYTKGAPSKSDWIGYFKKSRAADSNMYYTYQKTGGLKKGSLEFVAPNKLGICEFRLFQDNSYKIASRSGAFVVGNAVTVHVEHREDKSVVATISYSEDSVKSSWDWAAVFPVGASAMVDTYKWVKSGTLRFDAPVCPGSYEVRYFQSGSGTSELTRSNSFTVENTDVMVASPTSVSLGDVVTVSWTIDSISTFSERDWVGLFAQEAPGEEINPLLVLSRQQSHCLKNSGQLKFNVAESSGSFVFGFFRANSGRLIKASNSFIVKK